MAGTAKLDSLRLNRFETKRLAWALALSLAAHFLAWGGYELGKQTGLWQRLHWPERKQLAIKKVPPPPVQKQDDPTMFLDVDTDQVTPDSPQNAKYYSSKNSRAASSAAGNSNQPKLNGKQTDVPNTRDVPRTPNTKAQPMPEAQRNQEKQEALKSFLQAGDLKLAKLDTAPLKNETTPEKPRTINQALAQQHLQPRIAMQQEGGTQRARLVPALDAKATPFGEYDNKFIDAVQNRWYQLLDSQQFAQDRSGKVTLRFHLNYDGSVSDMAVLQNTVGELLCYVCQKAVNDPSPFEAWPSDMRHMVGANFREMTFTFYYYSN